MWRDHSFSQRDKATKRAVEEGGGSWTKFEKAGKQYGGGGGGGVFIK